MRRRASARTDVTGASARTGTCPPHRPRAAFALLAAVQITLILAITMLSPALPAVQREFALSGAALTLVSAAYGLSFSGLLLLGGRLADVVGRRRLLTVGVALFGVASAVAALAPGGAVLLAGRFAQGAGAALAAPSAMALAGSLHRDARAHARAMAVWGGLAGVGATAGMLVSGAVTTWTSWRWAFAVPVAVSTLVVALAPRLLPAGPAPVRARLDLPGAALVTAGLTALGQGLVTAGERPWREPAVWAPLLAGALLLTGFALVELRSANPLLPPAFLASGQRIVALGAVALGSAGMSTIFFLLSLHFQQVRGASPLLASAAFLPFCAVQLATGLCVGRIVGRFGHRRVMVTGLLIAAAGLWLIGRLGPESSYAGTLLAGLVFFPFGIGCVFSGATVAALDGVRERQAGLAAGVVNTALEVGPTVGLAVLVSLASARTTALRGDGVADRAATTGGQGFALTVAAAVFAAAALAVAVASRPPARAASRSVVR
ncbi:MFS transporter [Streptomyces sp. URMC 123]|uniref:MFS transporter n=1 Tax=Streptomyces sp. URMC 123 TaxID=3423403 RepID=UPI003F19AB7B